MVTTEKKIGILSLQGAVAPHEEKLHALGISTVQVRRSHHLKEIAGIILPGGESTTMIHLLKLNELWDDLKAFTRHQPTWGICAGSILLAKKVSHPSQVSLEAMDIEVERNAFGRQTESFFAPLEPTPEWTGSPNLEGVFIRAPRIRALSGTACTLFHFRGEPVMVEERNLLASTFHPELTDSTEVHQYFLRKCGL